MNNQLSVNAFQTFIRNPVGSSSHLVSTHLSQIHELDTTDVKVCVFLDVVYPDLCNLLQYGSQKAKVKHGGGSVLFWSCFAAPGSGCSESVQGVVKSQDYQGTLEQNMQSSVGKPGLCHRSLVLKQEKRAKSIQEWLRTKLWTVLKS